MCIGEVTIDDIGVTNKIWDNQAATMLNGLERSLGGRGANATVFSRVFGVEALLVAPIGIDFKTLRYHSYFKKLGLDTSGLFYDKSASTPRAFVFHETSGDNRTFFYGGVLDTEADKYIRHAISFVENSTYAALYSTSGIQRLNEKSLSNSRAELNFYAPGQEIMQYTPSSLRHCLNHTNILFVNEYEASILENKLQDKVTRLSRTTGVKAIIVTLGKHGSEIYVNGAAKHISSYKPEVQLESTGAGDAFAGAFIANYIKSHDLDYSAKIASATASFVVEKFGCQTNIPNMKSILRRIERG